MAKSPLPMLIRRSKLVVDERQAELAELTRQEDQATARLNSHDAARQAEQDALAQCPPSTQASFPQWLRQHQRERVRLADLHGKLVRTREAAQDALQEACADLKRLELADEARLKAEKQAENRRADLKAEEVEMIRSQHNRP